MTTSDDATAVEVTRALHTEAEAARGQGRRRRDRRRGLGDLLIAMARGVAGRDDPALLRGCLEETLRRLLALRSVKLRDAGARWSAAADRNTESVAFDVVGPTTRARAVLEATFEAGRGLGEWDLQVLASAAHLGALVLEVERARREGIRVDFVPAPHRRPDRAGPLIGSTPAMAALRSCIERVAATDFTVLIEGESGVGKELVARQIHDLSPRRNGPFVAINCAALVETLLEAELFGIEERTATGVRGRRGKFEHADGGTLFLDEVSDLSLSAQAKLLRTIQDLAVERVGGHGTHRVDIRIVAATNRPLADLVERRLFRPDLYYRLAGVDVLVPPLRDRRADVRDLARGFLERVSDTRRLTLSEAALQALQLYDWPGNVRELERLIERIVTLASGPVVDLDDLPAPVRGEFADVLTPSLKRGDTLRVWASRYARLTYERCRGNKRETARVLGISGHTLNSYLRLGDRPRAARSERAAQETPVSG